VLWIRIGFNADPDPHPAFYFNADPDPAFYLNADPDSGILTNLNPCGSDEPLFDTSIQLSIS